MPRLVVFLLIAQSVVSGAAYGYPTGLLIIPTADCLRPGEYCLCGEYNLDTSHSVGNLSYLDTQFGLVDRLEAGLDFEVSGIYSSGLFVNAKYVFAALRPAGIAAAAGDYVSAGFQNPVPYIVVSKRFSRLGLHLGMQRVYGVQRWFGGMDWTLNSRWTLMGDCSPGTSNVASLGLLYAVSDAFDVAVGEYFAAPESPPYVTLQLNFYGSFLDGD